MRQILVDHARRRHAGRRQGAQLKVSLSNAIAAPTSAMDLVELDQLLTAYYLLNRKPWVTPALT